MPDASPTPTVSGPSTTVTTTPRAPAREIFGWAMFDFANSSYTTVIVTVVFSVIFPRLVVGDGPGVPAREPAVERGAVGELRPGGADGAGARRDHRLPRREEAVPVRQLPADRGGHGAALLRHARATCVLGIVLVVVSNYGFAVGESFTSSFLPDLGPTEELGKISGYAWGLGYIGGIACTALVLARRRRPDPRELRAGAAGRARSRPLFFLVAAIPTFMFLRERGTPTGAAAGRDAARHGRPAAASRRAARSAGSAICCCSSWRSSSPWPGSRS